MPRVYPLALTLHVCALADAARAGAHTADLRAATLVTRRATSGALARVDAGSFDASRVDVRSGGAVRAVHHGLSGQGSDDGDSIGTRRARAIARKGRHGQS